MMMRLNFARALLHEPELLFLDEPTSGLDPVNARNVKRLILEEQSKGKTIVLTTHNMMDVEELCERVGFMVRGEMKTLGRTADLKARYGERTVRVEREGDNGADSGDFPLDGLGDNAAFLAFVRGRRIRTLHSQEATLDAVFTAVTGASLDAEEV
jgi:fluoroquinolone transport system ATP-binding protein